MNRLVWRLCYILFALCGTAGHRDVRAAEPVIHGGDRVVFLGDSVTHAGHYVSYVEAHLRLQVAGEPVEVINLGLPSENCTGLSEPDHPFPRPNVHDRLDRVLAKAKPDVVVACYGMNDGIYYPFDEDRFAKYRKGITELARKVKAAGARLVLLTPPAFDPLPMRRAGKLLPRESEKFAWFAIYEKYDDVMRRYAEWVLRQKNLAGVVVDVNAPIERHLAAKRRTDPDYVMSGDGVHVNVEGHRVIAQAIVEGLGLRWDAKLDRRLIEAIEQRRAVMHSAWLTRVGHKRPGVTPGLPLAEARVQVADLDKQITAFIAGK